LDVALVADEGAGSAVIFNAEVVKKCRQHFRDQWGGRIENILVWVMPGWICTHVIVHTVIVDGEHHRAKREHCAGSNNERLRDIFPLHGFWVVLYLSGALHVLPLHRPSLAAALLHHCGHYPSSYLSVIDYGLLLGFVTV
jgi:hypothetical protein